MAVGMVPVGVPARQLHAQYDDEGRQYIRRRVDGVGDHGAGTGQKTRQEFEARQGQVDDDGDCGNADCYLFMLFWIHKLPPEILLADSSMALHR